MEHMGIAVRKFSSGTINPKRTNKTNLAISKIIHDTNTNKHNQKNPSRVKYRLDGECQPSLSVFINYKRNVNPQLASK